MSTQTEGLRSGASVLGTSSREAPLDMNTSTQRTSILTVINDNSVRSADLVEILSDKIDVLYVDIQKLTEQTAQNYEMIIKLFQDFSSTGRKPSISKLKT